ncbi:MAG: hypothetical protein EOO06_14780 [Chitinophagaceae bacterium]|nr:MAG: hypothetical protein EOO06_14780 [Chitinophagaceae bacterium]
MKRIPGFLLTLILLLSACKSKETAPVQQKFDAGQWKLKVGNDFPHREGMLQDLIDNEKIKGLKEPALLEKLGQPDRTENGHFYYRISQKRIGLLPLSTRTLVIKFGSDSTVEWRKIHG